MKRPDQKRKYCGHCNKYLILPVFKRHKADHYDVNNRLWRTDTPLYDEAHDAVDDDTIMSSLLHCLVL